MIVKRLIILFLATSLLSAIALPLYASQLKAPLKDHYSFIAKDITHKNKNKNTVDNFYSEYCLSHNLCLYSRDNLQPDDTKYNSTDCNIFHKEISSIKPPPLLAFREKNKKEDSFRYLQDFPEDSTQRHSYSASHSKQLHVKHILATTLPLLSASSLGAIFMDRHYFDNRNACFPHLRYHLDDYVQYAPLGIGLCCLTANLPGATLSRRQAITAYAAAYTSVALIILPTKKWIGRLRPDGSSYNSFPSGHSAVAFTGAEMIALLYGEKYPILQASGFTIAQFVAWSRILNNRHWLSDTFAGAAVAGLSTEIGRYVACRFFGEHTKESVSITAPKESSWIWTLTNEQGIPDQEEDGVLSSVLISPTSRVGLGLLYRTSPIKEKWTFSGGSSVKAGFSHLLSTEKKHPAIKSMSLLGVAEASYQLLPLFELGVATENGFLWTMDKDHKTCAFFCSGLLFSDLYISSHRSYRFFLGYTPTNSNKGISIGFQLRCFL